MNLLKFCRQQWFHWIESLMTENIFRDNLDESDEKLLELLQIVPVENYSNFEYNCTAETNKGGRKVPNRDPDTQLNTKIATALGM